MKKKVLPFSVVFLLILIFTVSCANQPDSDWKKYTHKETGVNFIYPKTWRIPKQAPPGFETTLSEAEVVIVADIEKEEQFTPNINLVMEKSPVLAAGAMEQVEMIEASYELFGAQMGISGYTRLDLEEIEIGQFVAAALTYEMILSQTNRLLTGKQLIVPVGQNTYVLTCTASSSQWSEYELIFNEIIESFALE